MSSLQKVSAQNGPHKSHTHTHTQTLIQKTVNKSESVVIRCRTAAEAFTSAARLSITSPAQPISQSESRSLTVPLLLSSEVSARPDPRDVWDQSDNQPSPVCYQRRF